MATTQPNRTGADLLVEALVAQGVRHVFGMPGSHVTAIYDALARDNRLQTVLIRNEQAGAFAADGYARVTGRPGVICTTAGPGATNALSGVAEAWADTVPVLLLAGQVNSDRMHLECGRYHEIDLEAIFRPVTKYCGVARTQADVPRLVSEAFAAMTTGRPRPAALFLPQDLMYRNVDAGAPNYRPVDTGRPAGAEHQPANTGRSPAVAAAEVLGAASRPIILVGGGAVWAEATNLVREIARRLDCPVVTTLNGKGLLDERDPFSLGHVRSAPAKIALAEADAMLAVGCRFTEVVQWGGELRVPADLVQVDVDASQIGMNYPVRVGIHADARTALPALLAALPEKRRSGWRETWERARLATNPSPEWFIDGLRSVLPDDAVVFTDACEMGLRMHTDWPAYRPRSFFYPSNYIALGWGFPAAVGAAMALPGVPVVAVCGDGGFTMTSQELATAARYRLRLIVIVHNDSAYGAIKNIQLKRHGGRFRDVELNNPDFLHLAAAYGIPAARVHNAHGLADAVGAALANAGPYLIEVPDRWRSLRV